MADVNIMPQEVLLTSGQAATFTATDAAGLPVAVRWSLNPSIGTPPPDTPASSVTYIAPPLVATAMRIALIATNPANDSASTTISLTPDAIVIVPAKVDLKADQSQQFTAIVAGAAAAPAAPENVTWIHSPQVGTLDKMGLYKAPQNIPDSTTVTVMATSPTLMKQAVAAINLASPPWTGPGVNLLVGFLLLVFMFDVSFMVALWPPALPSPEAANANRIAAEKTLEDKTTVLEKAETESVAAKAGVSKLQAESNKPPQATGTSSGAKAGENATTLQEAQAKAEAAKYVLQRAQEARDYAQNDLSKKRDVEETVNNPYMVTILIHHINRELDLLLLVLLAGGLGSFLHVAQSYSDYIGNRTLKRSWASWYCFRPFIGAGLALVVYAAGRGGVMAIASGSNAKASELNPFGLVAVAALVGMFSKAATTKLGEVFDTLFKSDKAEGNKDKLIPSSQTSSQAAGAATTGGAAASAATK
jgi:hypothetical protein